MKRWGVFIGFAAIGLLLSIGVFMGTEDPNFTRKLPSKLIEKPAPDFELPDLIKTEITVSPKQYLGKVWLLNVWGSWCRECWREHGYLEQLTRQEGLTIVGLNWRDEKDDALNMLRRAGNPYQAIPRDPHSDTAIDWGVYGAPETFVIDKKGIIRHKQVGAIHQQVWEDELKPLLAKLEAEG